ncbi:VWA domain-containing protein [Roseibium sp. Sym1]|uniref:VWA domain-containing protein n=1 Tax=Roseibium sp. Sym1 TaxID=3016006 RepID=UPI0022B55896|nr:VWA domain-containing protein [Roseibium sp. Sym1]
MNTTAAVQTADTGGFPVMSPAQMSEYDFYLLLDSSGSMGEPSTRPGVTGTRWDEAKALGEEIAGFADEVDDDGISVITFASSSKTFNNIDRARVRDVFAQVSPGGSTRLAGALQEAVNLRKTNGKDAFVIVLTDGEATDKKDCVDVIVNAVNELDHEKQLTFLFIQIGHDRGAAAFLDYLDDELEKNGARFDCVDAIKSDVAESMNFGEMLGKAQVD